MPSAGIMRFLYKWVDRIYKMDVDIVLSVIINFNMIRTASPQQNGRVKNRPERHQAPRPRPLPRIGPPRPPRPVKCDVSSERQHEMSD